MALSVAFTVLRAVGAYPARARNMRNGSAATTAR